MIVTKLHIYGFGRFQDYQIHLSQDPIHVFVGENEAGKSTIKAFIRAILFGFPTKQQNELRYEPRLGGRLGGSVSIQTKKYGEVTVERVEGKAIGDVKVYFSDGSIGGDPELKLVLGEIDRTIFNGIYSFGITDLQTMEQLKSEELNRFMYGVGISGRHSLLELEKKVDKTVQNLYKPTGRKPTINNRLKKVIYLEQEVKSWKTKLNQHEQLDEERHQLEVEIQRLNEKKIEVNEKHRYYEKLKAITPIIVEKEMFENRLQQLPSYEPFPEDGLERFEKLQDQLISIVAEISSCEEKLTQNNIVMTNLDVYEDIALLEDSVAEIRENAKIYESKREEKTLLQQQKQYEQQELEVLKEKFGNNEHSEINCETSVLAEQQLEKLIEEEATSKQQQHILQSQYKQAKAALEENEIQVEKISFEILDDNKRAELETQFAKKKSETVLKQQLQFVDDMIENIAKQIDHISLSKMKRQPIIFAFMSVIFFISAIYFTISNNPLIGFFLLAIGLLTLMIMLRKNPYKLMTDDLLQHKEEQQIKRQAIVTELEKSQDQQWDHIESLLKADNQRREELSFCRLNLEGALRDYEAVCKQFDQWELGNGEFSDRLNYWATTYYYPPRLSASDYMKLFKLVERIKEKQRKLHYITEKCLMIENDLKQMEQKANYLCESLSIPQAINYQQQIEKLTEKLKKEQETKKLYDKNTVQRNEIIDKLNELQIKRTFYIEEIEKLYQFANVNCEEQFRQKGKAWSESHEINRQLRVRKSQVISFVNNEVELVKLEKDVLLNRDQLQDKIDDVELQLNSFWDQEKKLLERLAEIKLQIKDLEDGSSYSEALHHFELEKGYLNEEVKKWALMRTVKLLINKSKSVYEKERQPKVIQKASELFSFMTHEQYRQIFAPIGEQRLYVERYDGLRFEPNELSQGTREQLYLSLRWALATVHSKENGFPLFIDDIFVNFDEKRRLKAIQLLKDVSINHQIIFFSCHPFIANEISSNQYVLAQS